MAVVGQGIGQDSALQIEDEGKPPKDAATQKIDGPPAIPAKPVAQAASPPAKTPAVEARAPTTPFQPPPSFPVSMVLRPEGAGDVVSPPLERHFPGELSESFEQALARVAPPSDGVSQRSWLARLMMGRAKSDRPATEVRRRVAFDGFRDRLYDEKIERERRYGSVYTVEERPNAYLIRLELPRVLPKSSLEMTWELGEATPEYDYAIVLGSGFMQIKGAVAGEVLRRLSYISPSFPADFMTQISFEHETGGFVHRLRDKVLEVIVFKASESSSDAAITS